MTTPSTPAEPNYRHVVVERSRVPEAKRGTAGSPAKVTAATEVLRPAAEIAESTLNRTASSRARSPMFLSFQRRGISPLSCVMSNDEHVLSVLKERYQQGDTSLSEKERTRVEIALGVLVEDEVLERDIAAFVAGITTAVAFDSVHRDYSNLAWLGKVSQGYAMAMCTVLVSLCKRFGGTPNPVWLRYDLNTLVKSTGK